MCINMFAIGDNMAQKIVEYYSKFTWAADYAFNNDISTGWWLSDSADSSVAATAETNNANGGTAKTFSSVANAKTEIGFNAVFDTSSPTKTEALAESDTQLKVTYEFSDGDDMAAWKTAIDNYWTNNGSPFTGTSNPKTANGTEVRLIKQEHLDGEGNVTATINHPIV